MIYNLNDIILNAPSQTGHVVYPFATHRPDGKKIVFKKNKQQQAELTQFEMAFGALAKLLLNSNMTPQQHFVVDENKQVQGLVCDHVCYMIAHHEALTGDSPKEFYELDGKIIKKTKPIKASEDIPYYFLNQLEPGFFGKLRAQHQAKKLTIDMTSLASLLTTSYILEEDDLHKGNFGCYFIEKAGKPHAVFFKIDHDMMFADALMSYGHGRVYHWGQKDTAFKITAKDLMRFPLLRDSKNHYWPTSFNVFSKPFDTKGYQNFSDRKAFVTLAKDEAFNQEKWRSFLKHILIPPELVRETLKQTLDTNKPEKRAEQLAKINMIVQAFAARQSRLRSELFTVEPFIKFVNGFEQTQELLQEITAISDTDQTGYQKGIEDELSKYKDLCQPDDDLGDTPLHISIRLGDFRYYDKWHSVYSDYLNVANSKGETPLDLALSMITEESSSKDVRSDAKYIVKYLLYRGAISYSQTASQYNDIYRKYIDYKFNPVEYKREAAKIETFDGLKALMQSIDNDFRFSLKMKKKLSLFCLNYYISKNKNGTERERADILRQFKVGLNGDSKQHYAPELQFIRQLRSRFWIIRQFRGLIGGTSTQIDMNKVIDRELKRVEPKSPGCLSFFNCFKSHPVSEDQPEITLADSITKHPGRPQPVPGC